MEYVVCVRDVFKDLIIWYEVYDNANTAYHVKRTMDDKYRVYDDQQYEVKLIEPEYYE